MAVKTITVTERAYEALRALKDENESFSKTILRVARKKSLRDFAGALSKGSANKLEKAIKELRKEDTAKHERRMKEIIRAFEGG